MKILGTFLIVVSCGLYGIYFYQKCICHINFSQGLIDGFECIKNDIAFSMDVLPDSLFKAATFSGEASVFFERISLELQREGTTLSEAFDNCKNIVKNNTTNQVFTIVNDAVLQLGKSDVEGQHNLLNATIQKLKTCLEQQKKYCEKEGVMCKKIGFIAGIALSILLF